MEKTKMLLRAKSYLEMLAGGIDPISGMDVPEDSVLGQERLRNCFSFVAGVLEEAVAQHGLISLPENEKNGAYEISRKKAAFSIPALPRDRIYISSEALQPTAFVKNVNSAVDTESMEKLSLTTLNRWLKNQGLVEETKEWTTVQRTVRHVTPEGERVGIQEFTSRDPDEKTAKTQLALTRQAQEYILNHFSEGS